MDTQARQRGIIVDREVVIGKVQQLAGGRIVQEGPLAELREQPAEAFVRSFVDAQRPLEALT